MIKSSIILAVTALLLANFTKSKEHSPSNHVVLKDSIIYNPDTKLVEDSVHYLVQAQCATVCHNSQTILNNRFTKDGWRQKIRWMQATQNLWDLGQTEEPILNYLEKYYSPTISNARRKPLEVKEWYHLKK